MFLNCLNGVQVQSSMFDWYVERIKSQLRETNCHDQLQKNKIEIDDISYRDFLRYPAY